MQSRKRLWRWPIAALALFSMIAAGCGDDGGSSSASSKVVKIGAIPDQDPAKIKDINDKMAAYLSTKTGTKFEFVPVNDYASAVSLFKTGDLDVVWFGGLTGTQARLQTPGAVLLAQRDIDDAFQSIFIANASSGLKAVADVKGLSALKGKRFTYGSESSTSGYVMPTYFLDQAGVTKKDFSGDPGFSGSHDKTIDLVQAGTYEAGALNISVWKSRVAAGTVDTTKVVEVLTSPPYHDYHWISGPNSEKRFGKGFNQKVKDALLGLDVNKADDKAILALYGGSVKKFIETKAENYKEIEDIGRKLGAIK